MENGANAKRSSVSKLFALGLGIVLLVGGAWPASLGFADGRQSQTNELDSPTDVMAEGERIASSKEPVETDSSEVEGSMPGTLDVDVGLSVDPGIDQSASPENAEEKVGEGEMTLGGGDAAETAALAEPLAPVQSYAGADMFETAAAEAKAAYPEGSASAILVGPGGSWVDALSAAGLAASRGPILFTERGYLPEATAEALAELKAKSVVIVGGEAAVKPGVVDDLASMGISLEKRLYGADCYDTQMAVYEYGLDNGLWDASMAIVATASGFGDALSVSPVAFAKRAPIFLVEAGGMLRGAQQQALVEGAKRGDFTSIVIVGGASAVSKRVEGFVVGATCMNGGSYKRLFGATQYETSAEVAKWATSSQGFLWDNLAFATGRTPYDALAGSVLQGRTGSVLLLIDDANTTTLMTAVDSKSMIDHVRFFGGTSVISQKLRDDATAKLSISETDEGGDVAKPGGSSGTVLPSVGTDDSVSNDLGFSEDVEGGEA